MQIYNPAMNCRLTVHLLVVFFVVVTAPLCRAQQMNLPDSPCANQVVTTDLVDCLAKARISSDAKLNSLYQTIRQHLSTGDLQRLTETQRLWVKYRDANCSAERKLYDGGTASFPAYLGCIEAMTRERTAELQVTYAITLK